MTISGRFYSPINRQQEKKTKLKLSRLMFRFLNDTGNLKKKKCFTVIVQPVIILTFLRIWFNDRPVLLSLESVTLSAFF